MSARLRTLSDNRVGNLQPPATGLPPPSSPTRSPSPPDERTARERPSRQSEMKADHFRPEFVDHRAHFLIKRRAVRRRRQRRDGAKTELVIVRRQQCCQRRSLSGSRAPALWQKKLRFNGAATRSLRMFETLARILGGQHRTRQRTQTPRPRRQDRQIHVRGAGHRRLKDRKFGLEEVEKSAIWPHGSARFLWTDILRPNYHSREMNTNEYSHL